MELCALRSQHAVSSSLRHRADGSCGEPCSRLLARLCDRRSFLVCFGQCHGHALQHHRCEVPDTVVTNGRIGFKNLIQLLFVWCAVKWSHGKAPLWWRRYASSNRFALKSGGYRHEIYTSIRPSLSAQTMASTREETSNLCLTR